MDDVFVGRIAEELAGVKLQAARTFLVESLRRFIAIPLEPCGEAKTIHCTDVCTTAGTEAWFELSWQGFIASSDYRNDGTLVYGAHLFPFIGGKRACVMRIENEKGSYNFAFRYLMLTHENGWEDRGWQVDEYGEFEHWYLDARN
jgi:hypothetical protein